MKIHLAFGFMIAVCTIVIGQDTGIELTTEEATPFAEEIKVADLKTHLNRLASAEFEGRETGTVGQRKAASYIASVFESLDLPKIFGDTSYFQKIAFINESWNRITFTIADSTYRHLRDYYAYPATNFNVDSLHGEELVFLGYGIDDSEYTDYKSKKSIAGKIGLIFDGEPIRADGTFLITGTSEPSDWTTNWRKKLLAAKSKGLAMLITIDRDFKNNASQLRNVLLNRGLYFGESEQAKERYVPNVFINTNVAQLLLGKKQKKAIKARDKINKKGKTKSFKFVNSIDLDQKKRERSLVGQNVLGYVEGTDPVKKNELVVVTAHYDHLGKRGDAIYYGADDNGSGTSTILEVCQAFAKAKQAGKNPKRSVLFMLVSGEEKGLLGSEYYAAHPVFALENTIANVNVDMVGRVDKKYKDNPNYIYVIGADRLSSDLHNINEAANQKHTKLVLDYTYNREEDPNRYYYRSDHYNFAVKGIPAIFFFNGTHADYHRTSDTVEKINFEKMEKIGKLVFYTTWELANRQERIIVDKK